MNQWPRLKILVNTLDISVGKIFSRSEEELKENEEKRLALYKYTTSLIRAYANIANEMEEAGYTRRKFKI